MATRRTRRKSSRNQRQIKQRQREDLNDFFVDILYRIKETIVSFFWFSLRYERRQWWWSWWMR